MVALCEVGGSRTDEAITALRTGVTSSVLDLPRSGLL